MIDRASIVTEARSWIGTPYRHQASLKGVGCDCLGLVRAMWRLVEGEEPPIPMDYSSDWGDANGEETLLHAAYLNMRPVFREVPPWSRPAFAEPGVGDVLLFRWRDHLPAKHCAILTEPGRIIHAYDGAGKVCEVNFTPAWRKRLAGVFSFPALGSAS